MFKIVEWKEWEKEIFANLKKMTRDCDEAFIRDMINCPKFDREDIGPFCAHFVFYDVMEENVFVTHYREPNAYWYVNGFGASLIYHPKLSD